MDATKSKFTTLQQLCELIPGPLIPKLARQHNVEEKCRTFEATSHEVSLIHACPPWFIMCHQWLMPTQRGENCCFQVLPLK